MMLNRQYTVVCTESQIVSTTWIGLHKIPILCFSLIHVRHLFATMLIQVQDLIPYNDLKMQFMQIAGAKRTY